MSLTRNTERKDQVVQNMEASKYPQTAAPHISQDLTSCGVHVFLPPTPCRVQLSWPCVSVLYFITALNVIVVIHFLKNNSFFFFVSIVSFLFLTTHYNDNEYKKHKP